MSIPPISVAIIDDDKLYRTLLSKLLIRSGLVVMFHAENGKDCIDQLKTIFIHPMVVILDIEMPVMNGFDTAEFIRLNWPYIKIISNSSLISEDIEELAIKSGADIFLPKSLTNKDLIATINQLTFEKYYK